MSYSTDKIENGLVAEYERLFVGYKNQHIKILEIGIYNGGSLMWLVDFFPNARIVGGDAVLRGTKKLLEYNSRIDSVWQLDQTIIGSFAPMVEKCRPFDIIIDDGCHTAIGTQKTFEVLWKEVTPNGLYIIEDFIAGYWGNKKYRGLPNVITDIMLRKNDLSISDYGVILKRPKCSYAFFKKDNK